MLDSKLLKYIHVLCIFYNAKISFYIAKTLKNFILCACKCLIQISVFSKFYWNEIGNAVVIIYDSVVFCIKNY